MNERSTEMDSANAYEPLVIDVIHFEPEDIITTSTGIETPLDGN